MKHSFILVILLLVAHCIHGAEIKLAIFGWMADINSTGSDIDWYTWFEGVQVMFVLAVNHFNQRNGVLVDAFNHLGTCNKTFQLVTGKLLDGHGDPTSDMELLVSNLPSGIDFVLGTVFFSLRFVQ